jgi:hypothetical protein
LEKNEFVDLAPQYYALAIVEATTDGQAVTLESVRATFTGGEEENFEEYLQHSELLKRGLILAEQLGLVNITRDHFGPDLIQESNDRWSRWEEVTKDPSSPFFRYHLAGRSGGPGWLRRALTSINQTYYSLDMKSDDFDRRSDGWEPIPLDRDDKELQAAIAAIDATVEGLRVENGYGVEHAEEKAFVSDKLKTVVLRLREDTQISWMYLKEFALKPLTIIINRFGKAFLGATAKTARETVIAWLKSRGIDLLDDFFR